VSGRMGRRLIVTSAALLVIGVLAFSYLVVNQNYRILDQEFLRTSTYAGNVLEHMADGVVVVGRDGRITSLNRAACSMFGVTDDRARGRPCTEIVPMGDELLASLRNGTDIPYRERSFQADRRRGTFGFTATPVRDREGGIDSVVSVIRDLTEYRLMEENLRRTEKLTAMGELASGVAHEIRNPLNSVSMIAQRLAREFEPGRDRDEYRQLTATIVGESRRLSDIIQRFLKFARPPRLQPVDTDVRSLLEEAADIMMPAARSQGVSLGISGQSEGAAMIDRDQMKQALLNLVRNSLHATPPGGGITIGLSFDDERCIISVSDTGKGIPERDRNRIFDLYFTTKEEGTGMGLSIANQIVAAHGGRMEVESEEGRGTVFRIVIPRRVRGSRVNGNFGTADGRDEP
jgi:two-component system sensor histidine kinase HydH